MKMQLNKLLVFLLIIGIISCIGYHSLAKNKNESIKKIERLNNQTFTTLDFESKIGSTKENIDIVWNYILKDLQVHNANEAKEKFNVQNENIITKSVDLNDDGKNDILYIVFASYYWGTAGYSLGILENLGNKKYKNISYIINFEPKEPVIILNKKFNGFKIIKLWGSSAENFEKTLKYNKKFGLYCES